MSKASRLASWPRRLRRNVIDGGTFNNVTNIEITGANDTIRSLAIDADLTYRTATPAQLGFRPQLAISASAPNRFPPAQPRGRPCAR